MDRIREEIHDYDPADLLGFRLSGYTQVIVGRRLRLWRNHWWRRGGWGGLLLDARLLEDTTGIRIDGEIRLTYPKASPPHRRVSRTLRS